MAQAPRLPSRTFKLLEEAQGSVQGEQALLDYLSSEHDIDFMKEMLRPLDPSLIPSGPLPPVGIRALRSAEYKKAQNALKALENSATFFKILSLAPPSESVTASTNMCLTILIDIWPGITEWILYCFMHAHRFMNPATVVGMCAVLLIGVTNNPSGPRGVLREELALMTCTIDILFILLGGIDRKTGEYFILWTGNIPCLLIQALRVQFSEDAGSNALISRLSTVRRKTRRATIASLVDRAPLLIATARASVDYIGLARSLEFSIDCLRKLGASTELWKEMSRQGFPSKQTLALVGFVELGVEGNVTGHDFWTPIVNATAKLAIAVAIRDSEPAETFAKMFEAGFFFCITRCLPYVSEGSRLPLKIMQPYMHGQKVIEALFSRRGDFEMFRDRRGLPKRVEAVCLAFEVNMTIARTVYISRGAVPISLCSNLKHSTSRPSYIEGGDEPLKTCSACRAVFYCSPICQEEDWRTLHKEECCVLAQKGTNLRGIKTTLGSVRTKREQLAYLKYALDSDLDIIHGKPATRKGLRVSSEGRTIRFLDFSNSPAQWPEAGSKVELDFTGIDCEWAERIDKCISGTERELLNNPDQVFIFVEGMFSLAQFRRTCVFVTMREDPNAPKEYRWEVVTSVFRESG